MKRLYIFLFIVLCYSSLLGQSSLYLKTPYDEAVFSTDTDSVTFLWNSVGAASYDLEIADEPTFTTPITFITNSNQSTINQASLFPNVNYWRVSGNNGTSIVRSFKVQNLDDFGSIVYHIDAGSNVSMDNGRVSGWGNKASGLYNATQGTASLRPEFINSVINNKPVVKFGGNIGTNQYRLSLSPFELEQSNFSAFFTLKQHSVNSALPYVLGYQGNGRTGGVHVRGTAGSYNNFGIVYDSPLVGRRPNFTGDLNWATRSIVNNQIYFNVSEVDGYTGAGVDGIRFNTIGTRPDVTSLNFHGDIAEVIIYNSNLTPTNRQIVEEYLITKYRPYPDLGNDMDTCASQITLGSIDDPAFNTVSWSNGENDVATITVNQNGWYWVETGAFDRIVRDSIYIDGLVPKPILTQENDTTICLYDTLSVGYINTLLPGISAEWHDGSTSSTTEVFEQDTVYSLFSNTGGCTISSDTLLVNINEFPVTEGLGADRTICLNTELYFEYGTISSEPYTHLWGDGSTSPSFEPTVVGNQEYTIEVTDFMGCTAFDTVDITLANTDGPLVDFTFDIVCPYTAHQFIDQSSPSPGDPIAQFVWRLPEDTLNGVSVSYSHSDTTSYIVELEVTTDAGCSNIKRDTAKYYPQPFLNFSTTGICQEQQISFNGGQLTPTPINTWQWNFDDPASGINNEGSGQNTTHIFESSGGYDVELIGTDVNGCSDTVVETITIAPVPEVDFSFDEVCVGSLIDFDNLSTIQSPGSISGYNWSFGDGTFSGQTEPQKFYSNYGTYSVTLNATGNNGCSGQLTQPLKIHAFPIVDQDISSSCAGIASVFNDSSVVANGSIAEVYWSLNGASAINGFNVENIFENSGSQTIDQTVVSAFGCSSSESYTIQIDDFISADFEIEPTALLAGYPTSFNNLSIGALTNEWIFDNLGTSTDVSPNYTFPESLVGDEVTIELKLENSFSCRDSVSLTLPVLSPRTDLAIDQLFLQEDNGFYVVGVELENNGTTPITSAVLFLRTPSTDVIKEVWEGELQAGETEIYIFSASPSMTVPQGQMEQNYVCVEAQIKTPLQFKDEDLSNNDNCKAISESSGVLIVPHPNPVDNELNIQLVLPFDEVGTLEIYNAQGQIVAVVSEGESFQKGLNSYKINTELWQSGNYSIVYNGENEQQIAKVVKL
jgi:hypothetical protein